MVLECFSKCRKTRPAYIFWGNCLFLNGAFVRKPQKQHSPKLARLMTFFLTAARLFKGCRWFRIIHLRRRLSKLVYSLNVNLGNFNQDLTQVTRNTTQVHRHPNIKIPATGTQGLNLDIQGPNLGTQGTNLGIKGLCFSTQGSNLAKYSGTQQRYLSTHLR